MAQTVYCGVHGGRGGNNHALERGEGVRGGQGGGGLTLLLANRHLKSFDAKKKIAGVAIFFSGWMP